MSPASIRLFGTILERHSGQELSPARSWRIGATLGPLLRIHGIASLDELADLLAAGAAPALEEATVDALVNHETSFFRDLATFEGLTVKALPRLAAAQGGGGRLRIWCAGCSTGQEAYSLAMAVAEEPAWQGWAIDIVATDMSQPSIDRARAGCYSQMEVQRGLSARRLIRWFERDGACWRLLPALRARVRFERRSLLDAPPAPGAFDVILCRNVMLYFPVDLRRRLIQRFAAMLSPEGVLMLGAGEAVMDETGCFAADRDCRGLYRRCPISPPPPAAVASWRPAGSS